MNLLEKMGEPSGGAVCLLIKLEMKLIKAFIFNLGLILKGSVAKCPKKYAPSVIITWAAEPEGEELGASGARAVPTGV